MEHFILRWTGQGEPPPEDVRRIRESPEVKVVDSSSRMLLVQGSESALHPLVRSLPAWSMSAEQFVPVPDPRPKLR